MLEARDVRRGERHLRRADPVMQGIIREAGPCRLVETRRPPFRALIGAIIAQQISVHAARSITRRLLALYDGRVPSARRLLASPDEDLRLAGLSSQKIRYLRDLAEHVTSRRLRLSGLHAMPDDEVIERLTEVKGIGVWTAQMFLIFHLNRPDVLPTDDLGLLDGARISYGLPERPDADRFTRLAEPWRPYRSVACWYLWQARRLARGDELR